MKKITCLAFLLLFSLPLAAQTNPEISRNYQKFAQLLLYIDSHYMDSASISKLTEKAVINTLQNLDPHSTYLTADEVKSSNESLHGNFEGVGIEFNILNDTLTVVSPISGGPSQAVGIRAADRIIAVDNENIAGVGLTNAQVLKFLRGPKGTKVLLTVVRKGAPQPLRFTVVRDKIPIHSVEAAYEVQPGMAYIRLGRFSMTTLEEINEALKKKFKKAPTSMILDLRSNSGGVFKTSIDLCDQFFDSGRLLVYSEGLHYPKTMELSGKSGFFQTGNLVVLLDEGSASASEIVAGCIQDWDRGILIGRRSYGKGLVQQLLPLSDGSQIRLTVARYHTPTGRVIQRPYNAGETEKYYADLYKRALHGELYSRDSIRFPDSLKYYTLVKQRTVYGGGGIMPDIFMPRDTTYSKYYDNIIRAGHFNQFTLKYVDAQRSRVEERYKTIAAFDEKLHITDDLFEQFLAYVET